MNTYKKYFSKSLLMGNFFSCMIACWFFNQYNNDYKNLNNKNNFNGTLILLTMYGFFVGGLIGVLKNNYLNNENLEDWKEELYQFSDDSSEESYNSSSDNETQLFFKKMTMLKNNMKIKIITLEDLKKDFY